MNEFASPSRETENQRMRHLLGLREFPKRNVEEIRLLLGSDQRLAALEAIATDTLPRSKKDVKKGIALEAAEKGLISKEVLQGHSLTYIGSGTDIEYPLALGARIITMVDPIFADPKAQEEVLEKVKRLISKTPVVSGKILNFQFDFGEGQEEVTVKLVAKSYPYTEGVRAANDFDIEPDTGVIVLYASQGPRGQVSVRDSMKEKLSAGG